MALPYATAFAGKFTVLAQSPNPNDQLMARTYKLTGGGGFPPMPPTEATIEAIGMSDTSALINYIYAANFNSAVFYPLGTNVKWKVNRYTTSPSGIVYGTELTRGETAPQ
jgi:hypothetical protein